MINSLFIAKTGMEAQQTQLDVISHNWPTSPPPATSARMRCSRI
jgi:flagellar basal body rod protein FlgC